MVWQSAVNSLLEVKMKWTSNVSSLIKEIELRKSPVIIRVNKFDEDSAKKFDEQMSLAHNLSLIHI